MGVSCDYCGKVADAKGMPPGESWLRWIMDDARGEDAIVVLPNEKGEIAAICYSCLEKELGNFSETQRATTGTAKLGDHTIKCEVQRTATTKKAPKPNEQGVE